MTSGATWTPGLLLGALLGALSLGWVQAIGRLVAARTGLLWTVQTSWLLALLVGAAVGALTALGVLVVLRRVLPRVDTWCAIVGTAALSAPAARVGLTAALRGRVGMPGDRAGALALAAALVLVALGVAVTLLGRRRDTDGRRPGADGPGEGRRLLVDGACLVVASGTTTVLAHALWLADREAARGAGLLGAPGVLLMGAALLAGVLVGWLLMPAVHAATTGSPAAGADARPAGREADRAGLRGSAVRRLAGALLIAMAAVGGLAAVRAPGTGSADAQAENVHVARRGEQDGTPGSPRPGDAERPPNVLLVVLDTLRRDAVSCYGAAVDTTPAFDAFAASGVRHLDVVAPGNWTVPSHGSLFTGAQVSRHGAGYGRRRLVADAGGGPLPTLAELLSSAGFDTAAFVANRNLSRGSGFDRGFDRFHEIWSARQGDADLLAPLRDKGLGGTRDKGGALLVSGVRRWLADPARRERPWLLFVNMMEAHAPYDEVPRDFARRHLDGSEPTPDVQALLDDRLAHVWHGGVTPEQADQLHRVYMGAVAYQDALLGELLADLERAGQAGSTLVIVTSDHGENFGWEGLLGHGQGLNEALLAVPFAMAGPGVPAGGVDGAPASLLDVLPTVLERTGVSPLPADPGRPGVVLGVAGARAGGPRPRIVERLAITPDDGLDTDPRWVPARAGLHLDGWRLIAIEDDTGPRLSRRSAEAGWRTAADPDDPTSVLAERLATLRAAWRHASSDPLPLPPDVIEELRELGYVGG